ncbi:MAG: glycosyltransferase family 1 protein, partial [Bacteroidia bacterium]|nr:glycosyltransferase family 1 protein [Bacteroidia bacterium]
MNKSLHIITLNIPYPADYGGMIDSFHRIRSLNKLGINIHLHCFEYGRPHSRELETLCKTVNYYPRRTFILNHYSLLPYNVFSRRSYRLLKDLMKDDF